VKCEEQSEDHRNEDAAIECRCYFDKFSGLSYKYKIRQEESVKVGVKRLR
jgi:hypothetical protein